MTDIFERLKAPFPPEAIHWRAQLVVERGGSFSALALAYIDARDVMNRFDDVCGPAGWTDSYVETAKGRTIGTIAIKVGDEWISKSDGAGDTDVEGEKGSISDALKRTAVKWGIGRYLYSLGNIWADCEAVMKDGKPVLNKNNKPMFAKWTPGGLRQLAAAVGNEKSGKAQPTPDPIRPDQNAPESVKEMIRGLQTAFDEGIVETYWKQHWPAVPQDWRPHVLGIKELMKAGGRLVAITNA